MIGLVTLYDPPRPDAKQLITSLRNLGVAVKMLTGDALAVATRNRAAMSGLPNIRRVADLKAGGQAGRSRDRFWRVPTVLRKCTRKTNTSWCSICRPQDM